jgi:RNA:NAD 2'-phosphotransferase (TPT1/KptA family)
MPKRRIYARDTRGRFARAAAKAASNASTRSTTRSRKGLTVARHRYTGKNMLLYHGTTKANAAKIAKTGLKASQSATWFTLTSSRKQARAYANPDSPAVVKFKVARKDIYKRGNKTAKLWPGVKHNVYGVTANAYAPKTTLKPRPR